MNTMSRSEKKVTKDLEPGPLESGLHRIDICHMQLEVKVLHNIKYLLAAFQSQVPNIIVVMYMKHKKSLFI